MLLLRVLQLCYHKKGQRQRKCQASKVQPNQHPLAYIVLRCDRPRNSLTQRLNRPKQPRVSRQSVHRRSEMRDDPVHVILHGLSDEGVEEHQRVSTSETGARPVQRGRVLDKYILQHRCPRPYSDLEKKDDSLYGD